MDDEQAQEKIRQIAERARRSARATKAARAADRRREATAIRAGFEGAQVKVAWR